MTMPRRSMKWPDRDQFLMVARLKARGWTETLIRHFFPVPDETRPNPHFSKAAPVKFFAIERVEAAEATEEFRAAFETASPRKAAAARAVATKREQMRGHLASIKINV